ncbi:heat shock transcription factor, X-linked-like [Cuculus canorus]|uniref:heat shock transcription factor, X-linked-like n=1 Tax=Cuculus canorus TaxID=55661 RepID=UPI0023AAC9FF|nr:heat shock transcription factor, X-linked-like [Cuculus canorus]
MTNNRDSPLADSSSDTEEPGWVPSSPNHAGRDMAAPGNAASAPLAGENFQARRFLSKLWEIVGSHHFQSIWWADNGNCIVIAETLFCEEALRRNVFGTDSMGGFILQLHLHGFDTLEDDCPISMSVEELQAIVAAGPSLGRLHFFYNPFFRRDQPELLGPWAQSPGEGEPAPAAAPRSPGQEDERRKRRADALVAEEDMEENGFQSRAAASPTATEPWADLDAPSTSAGPAPAKRRRKDSAEDELEAALAPSMASPQRPAAIKPWADADGPSVSAGAALGRQHQRDSPENVQEAAVAPSAPSPQRRTPPAPLLFGPPPHPDWWPALDAEQVPGAGALPFLPPAPHAAPVPRPQHHRGPVYPHCPSCYCPPNDPTARHGDGR